MPLKQFTVSSLNTDILDRDHKWQLANKNTPNSEGLTFEEWAAAVFCDVPTPDGRFLDHLRVNGALYNISVNLLNIPSVEIRSSLLSEWHDGVDPSEIRSLISKRRERSLTCRASVGGAK